MTGLIFRKKKINRSELTSVQVAILHKYEEIYNNISEIGDDLESCMCRLRNNKDQFYEFFTDGYKDGKVPVPSYPDMALALIRLADCGILSASSVDQECKQNPYVCIAEVQPNN